MLLLVAGCLLIGREADAAPAIQLEPVATGLDLPMYVTSARDGTGRLFIAEQAGVVKVLQPGSTTPTVFLDIRDRVSLAEVRGLLGLAFHPQFAANRRFFVHYTRTPDCAVVVAEYRASADDPNAADRDETVLLAIQPPSTGEHNGGMLEFGPDGYLYVGVGDGGGNGDPANAAQDLNQLFGKILRIDVDRPSGGLPYSSPATNPFAGPTPGRDEIFAYGFRNPFRFSFDRATGALIAGDVGEDDREEIDLVEPGRNYGWPFLEGTRCTGRAPERCGDPGLTPPIFEYSHRLDFGDPSARCSITSGYVYRGARGTLPQGTYVFGDFCSGEIFLRDGSELTVLLWMQAFLPTFGEDEAGELYVTDLFKGVVYRLVPAATAIATAVLPGSRSVQVGTPATAFATMVWPGAEPAVDCAVAPVLSPPGTFVYQTTDAATNEPVGAPNTPVSIPPGGSQTFVIAFTPSEPVSATHLALTFACANTPAASVIPGVTTLLVSGSPDPVPDVIAIAATPTGDGIVELPAGGGAAFSLAAANAGSAGRVSAEVEIGGGLPIAAAICRTDSATGACLSPPGPTAIADMPAGATSASTFSVFVTAGGAVPFDPAVNRIFVRFRDQAGETRGLTSVAVRTR